MTSISKTVAAFGAAIVVVGSLSVSARAATTFGAVAISAQSGVVGRATGAPSQAEAERLALDQCAKLGGTDCRVATWTRGNYCGAVAVKTFANGGLTWASSTAPTLPEAKTQAMQRCEKAAQSPCDDVVADVCSN
jgi:hypothetical protein